MFKQHLLCLKYDENIQCIIDKGGVLICRTHETNILHPSQVNPNLRSFEPYIPRAKSVFYTCTTTTCRPFSLVSMTQLSHPSSSLRNCFNAANKYEYVCEIVKYQHYSNNDKLLFLANNIPRKVFYLADCLVYANGDRICHRKTNGYSHANLVNTGTIVKPNKDNILSQDELICEETDAKKVYCDYNLYVPYASGLKKKEPVNIAKKILLKSGSYLIQLKYKCKLNQCGYYSENILSSRRSLFAREYYEPPGGSVYRCYYAKKQQICKKLYGTLRHVYNERDWLSS